MHCSPRPSPDHPISQGGLQTQQLKWLWSKDSMNSTINQRLVEQIQEMNCKLEGSGGSTLDDTLGKQYLSSSDE